MVIITYSSIALTLFTYALALPTSNLNYEVFEHLDHIPTGWTMDKGGHVNLNNDMSLRIHLKQQNLDAFEKRIYDMSTPDHPNYGNHMSTKEIKDMIAPHDNSVLAVTQWLKAAGVPEDAYTVEDDWVTVKLSIGDAQDLLKNQYSIYRTTRGRDERIMRATEYSVPVDVSNHINMIYPTISFGRPKPAFSHIKESQDLAQHPAGARIMAANAAGTSGTAAIDCDKTVVPSCIRTLYNFTNYTPPKGYNNKFAVSGYLEEYAQNADLTKFLNTYEKAKSGASFACQPINGGLCRQDQQNDTREANLDVQFTVPITTPIPVTFYSTAGRGEWVNSTEFGSDNYNEPYLTQINYFLKMAASDLPQTLSTSYGDDEATMTRGYAISVCNAFSQLTARGVSIIFSSGDDGPGDSCSFAGKKQFIPEFPTSCPWVTSVGATAGFKNEHVVDWSGGSFSNFFARPSYQDTVVKNWISKYGSAQAQYYNASGRAYPDVSAQGTNFHIINNGTDMLVNGTSASAPTFASIIALLNGDRLSQGKKPLGFLNPWLYTTAISGGGLKDMVTGGSVGCTSAPAIAGASASFPAVPGWEPSGGLGTPVFPKLLAMVRSMK